jgi:hypothetical protein
MANDNDSRSSVQTMSAEDTPQEAVETFVEIYKKGSWLKHPALEINNQIVFIDGKLLRAAMLRSEAWLEKELENPERWIAELRRNRSKPWRADILTFSQKLPAIDPKYHYHMDRQSIAAVRLTSFAEWWETLPQATRKNVRRSEKRGVQVVVRSLDDELVEGLVELTTRAPVQQGSRNRQYGKSAEEIRKDFGSFLDRSELFCAYVGAELVGFLKLVHRGEVASIINLIVKASHQDKRPANALIAKAVESASARHMQYVIYGCFDYGNKREGSLREFKIRNGFSNVLVPKYCVPLTTWGAFCIRLGLHRGLIGIVPYRFIEFIVRARAKWYDVKYSKQPV